MRRNNRKNDKGSPLDRPVTFGRDFLRSISGSEPRPERKMYKAICSECKKECEVPFKPNGSKPVFCRDCFRKRSGR